MSHGGDRGALGRGRARAIALLLIAAFALPIFVMAPAEAQSQGDPWWGPSDRSRPTAGWAVRVPVVVENRFDYPLDNPLVTVDVDFGKLLVKAGWTNATIGATTVLAGFTLDEGSIRVVEYGRGFSTGPIQGATTPPTPAVFFPGAWSAEKFTPYSNQTNPAGTLLVALKGRMQPFEKRYLYVYANPREFETEPMQPPAFSLAEKAPLDAYLWGNAGGQVFHGFVPQQGGTQRFVVVHALQPQQLTTVTLHLFENGKFSPAPVTGGNQNPQYPSDGNDARFIVPAGKAFKIVADRPVTAVSYRVDTPSGYAAIEAGGFVPSLDGSYAGRNFTVFGVKETGSGQTPLTLIRGTQGSVTVTADDGRTTTLTPANPVGLLLVPAGEWTRLTGNAPFLVSLHPFPVAATEGQTITSVPSLTGAVEGTEFYAGVPADGGVYTLCADEPLSARVVSLARPSLQAFPEGPTDTTPPLAVAKGCQDLPVATTTPAPPLDFYSAVDPRTGVDTSRVPMRLLVGAASRNDEKMERPGFGFVGGTLGTEFVTAGRPGESGRIGLFGHYNGTSVSILEERLRNGQTVLVPTNLTLAADKFVTLPLSGSFDASSLGRFHVRSSKPIQVVYVDAMQSEDGARSFPYAQFLPGRAEGPLATVGAAEFRGPLVELRSPDAPGRHDLPKSGGPGNALDFRLDVLNLGRWIGGEGLPDTVSVTCKAPSDWRVTGCERDLVLGPGASERLLLGITPSAADVNTTRTVVVEAQSKSGGSPSLFRFVIYVEVRYGVGMWFDVEGGRKTIDPPVGVDPGETHRYSVVVKNTGSTADTYDLRVQEPKPGWTQAATLDGAPVRSITLEAGESKVLHFDVTAPPSETAPKNFVSLSLQSQSSLLSGDVVNTATQIRPRISIRLTADPQTQVSPPGQNATFNLTVNNSGNSIFLIRLQRDSDLPEGWNATFSVEPPEVNLNPGDQFTFGLNITPPAGARAGELAALKVTALVGESDTNLQAGDQVSAVVVVRRMHALTIPNLPDTEVEPGETLRYLLPLANAGNGQETLEILPGAVSPAWRLTTDSPTLNVPYNESAELPLTVEVPPGAPAGATNLTFTVRLSREATQNLTLPLHVRSVARLAWSGLPALAASPGRPTSLDATVTNVGNLAGDFAFEASAPEGWNVTFLPARARLEVGQVLPVRVLVNASRAAADGAFSLGLGATYGEAAAGNASLDGALARPQLYLGGVQTSGTLASGELVLVSASVGNRGAIAAENVTVALVVDGVAVDKVVLARIAVNDTKVATLNWVSTGKADEVRVVIDPQGEIVQASRDQTDAVVTFSSRVPGFEAALLVLACAGALLLLGRRSA